MAPHRSSHPVPNGQGKAGVKRPCGAARRRRKLWHFLTANTTSWTATQTLLHLAQQDIVLLQEHKASDSEVQQYNRDGASAYRLHAVPAVQHQNTDIRRRSAGVAIATKRTVRYTPPLQQEALAPGS